MKKKIVNISLRAIIGIMAIFMSVGIGTVQAEEIEIRALIDGSSVLIIGADAQWFHDQYAAPGRHDGADEPTYINDYAWYPEWPDVPDSENRDCECYSSVYTPASPIFPPGGILSSVEVDQGREIVDIIQEPSPDTNYILVILFDDTDTPGSDWYNIRIVYNMPPQPPIPEMPTMSLMSIGMLGLFIVSRIYGIK